MTTASPYADQADAALAEVAAAMARAEARPGAFTTTVTDPDQLPIQDGDHRRVQASAGGLGGEFGDLEDPVDQRGARHSWLTRES